MAATSTAATGAPADRVAAMGQALGRPPPHIIAPSPAFQSLHLHDLGRALPRPAQLVPRLPWRWSLDRRPTRSSNDHHLATLLTATPASTGPAPEGRPQLPACRAAVHGPFTGRVPSVRSRVPGTGAGRLRPAFSSSGCLQEGAGGVCLEIEGREGGVVQCLKGGIQAFQAPF
jgi:hypothetical protein